MRNKIGKVDYKYLYAEADYGDEEKRAVAESLENPWLAAGPKVKEFEEAIASLFGHIHGIATNSGSSANLLALEMFDFPEGGEVITPACTFSTTVSSILQNGLVPVFVDSVIGRYVMDEDLVEQAITPKTVAILVPHLIGGVADLPRLRQICDTYHLRLIEDSCDTIGIRINDKPSGEYADASTTSFYGSHIITAMGYGGMLMTSDITAFKRATTFKDWGRIGGDSDNFEERFNYQIDGIPYDVKFLYSEFGYNLKMNEGAATFGLEQLKKLSDFQKRRSVAFENLLDLFRGFENFFYLPKLIDNVETSWLAFPLTLRKDAPFERKDFLGHLEAHGIQTRVLFSGNITRHPAYRRSPEIFRVASELTYADRIMEGGLLLGAHQKVGFNDLAYLGDVAKDFLRRY